jgi:energy-coupling factor transporter transmembrane protein EcfT
VDGYLCSPSRLHGVHRINYKVIIIIIIIIIIVVVVVVDFVGVVVIAAKCYFTMEVSALRSRSCI